MAPKVGCAGCVADTPKASVLTHQPSQWFRLETASAVALALLAAFLATTLQGCLPPDWSFCDCDFRDNFWNHVLNDVHLLFDGPDFQRKARDNLTFQGKYLENPPQGFDCPEQAIVFWKAWPQFGMSRGLIEGSMGDLWMPGARDRIKGVCMAGHLALCVICSQHFLVKAGRAMEAGESNHMRWMEAAYSHMVVIRNMGQAYQLRNCMGQQGWPLKVGELHAYTEKWLGGRESEGTSPVAAYMGGQLDPFQMLFDQSMQHSEKSRTDALPDRRPCVPFKAPECWKRMSKLLIETCEHCCSPFIHKSGRGDPWCFDSVWTYERCCQTDFADLVCELKRAGEEGGCVDCKKTVSYSCLTPPEKRLQESQDNYNREVDKYNTLQDDKKRLAQEIAEAQTDMYTKDGIYKAKYTEFDSRLQVWNTAYNNVTRLLSEARLQQQQTTWNNSAQALATAHGRLETAQQALQNVTRVLREAEDAEEQGRQAVERNETENAEAVREVATTRMQLFEAMKFEEEAGIKVEIAERDTAVAAALEARCEEAMRDALRAWENTQRDTIHKLESTLVAQRDAELAENNASLAVARSGAAAELCRLANQSALEAVESAAATMLVAEEREAEVGQAVLAAAGSLDAAAQHLHDCEGALEIIRVKSSAVNEVLLSRVHRSAAMECLISKTPANRSARPRISSHETTEMTNATCEQELSSNEDQNEFCISWARAGECARNPEYMRRSCPKSCSGTPSLCSKKLPQHAQKPPIDQAELAILMAELKTAEATTPALEPQVNPLFEDMEAPEKLAADVDFAVGALQAAHEHVRAAQLGVESARAALADAKQVLQETKQHEAQCSQASAEASSQVYAAEEVVQFWKGRVLYNETLVAEATEAVEDRLDDHQRLNEAADQARALEQGLEKARDIAEQAASQKREAMARLSKRCKILDEHVNALNASISENLTTAVSEWLSTQDEREAEERDAGMSWGIQLLRRVKSAVVSLVASIESFLDDYGMSMTDKEVVAELIRAIEDRRSATAQHTDAETAVASAEAHARDAQGSLAKAVTSALKARQATRQAADRIPEAREEHRQRKEILRQAKDSLNASEVKLQQEEVRLAERRAEQQAAAKAVASAAARVATQAGQVRNATDAVDTSKAEVVEATFGLAAAKRAREQAEATAVDTYYRRLRDDCQASQAEFEVYMEQRELLCLLNAVIAVREHGGRALAAAQHSEATSNYSDAIILHNITQDAMSASRLAHINRLQQAANASSALRLQEEAHAEAMAMLKTTEEHLAHMQEATELVHQQRRPVEAKAANATMAYTAVRAALKDTLQLRSERIDVLHNASKVTAVQTRVVEAAEDRGTEARRALAEAREWFVGFVETLLLGEKREAVRDATAREGRRQATHEKATRRERSMKLLLGTHERHLKLLNDQVELQAKEAARVFARDEFKQAEQAFVDAEAKLAALVKSETETGENIATTYQELQKLLEEHSKAKEGYDRQDPEERKRSFSTSLSGSGPDPNGIDVR